MFRPKVLALDVAAVTGWCCDRVPERHLTPIEAAAIKPPQPLSGVIRFGRPGCSDGEQAAAAEKWLEMMFETHKPDGMITEMPILPAETNPQTILRLNGLVYLTRLVAHRHRCAWVREGRASQVRKAFCGTGSPGKQHNKFGCIMRGWTYQDDNQADALALHCFASVILEAEARARKGVAA